MKKLQLLTILTVLLLAVPIHGQNCIKGAKLARQLKAYYEQNNQSLNNTKIPYMRIEGVNKTGTLYGQGTKTIITDPPKKYTCYITIQKTDGRAKTKVVVCSLNKNGTTRFRREHTFPNGNNTLSKRFKIAGTKDEIIIISMKNLSVGNKFKYRIETEYWGNSN
ncbi:MAG: hypothetical protein OIF50_00915 [Flavobacteriaceae bacterium]|nr:hypothetical protein [Flavobacteriaceae bacterium]